MISEDIDDNDEVMMKENYDPDVDYSTRLQEETIHHNCWIKNLNRLLCDQNKHKCKAYFCDRCLHDFTKEDFIRKHKEDCYGINKNSPRVVMQNGQKSHCIQTPQKPNAHSISH